MEIVVFRQITFDTAYIPPGGLRSTTLFEAVPRTHEGSTYLTELDEKTIVRWLLLAPPARQILLEELGLPMHSFCCPEVVEPFYAPGERDLDILLCPPLSPHAGFAIECKRVKVESINAGEDRINKLQETREALSRPTNSTPGLTLFTRRTSRSSRKLTQPSGRKSSTFPTGASGPKRSLGAATLTARLSARL